MVSPLVGQAISFVGNLATSYLLGRLSAQDGSRMENLAAGGGDYGVPMPRGFGHRVRIEGIFIAQADIKETKHKVEDYSEVAGVIGGAATGFSIGGPVGAGIGAVVGGLLGFAAPDQVYYTYSDTIGQLLLDRAGQEPVETLVKIWANGKLIFSESPSKIEAEEYGTDGVLVWRQYHKNKYFKSLRIYTGHEEQDVDPDLEDDVDEDNGYIFSCYVVMEDLQLAAFGNSVPDIEYLVQIKTGETFADAAEYICSKAGIDHERDLSSTALTSYELRGVALVSETTCWDALKPLLPVFGVDAAEVSGQIRFYKRSQYMRSTFTTEDLGAHQYGDSAPEKFLFKRSNDLSLPKETSLTFVDPDRGYQANTATSTRSEGDASSNIAITIPVVMSADEGASAVELMHWDAWLGRTQLSFSLTDGWISLATGHAYGFPFADTIIPYRITRKLRGANGVIEVEALSDESVTYTASVAGSSGTIPDDESTEFADTRLVLMDMPITSDGHDDYGFYIAMGETEGGWTRGRIEISRDGVTFVSVIDQPYSAIIGDVTGTLAAGTTDGLDDTLDTTTVLTVVLEHDLLGLESATDDELDNWKNFAFVGKDGLGEYLQFKTATHVSGSTWELTNLRRGRRGTDHAIATHTSGEEFALIGDGIYRLVYGDTSEWGEEFTFRGVTLHQDSEDADEQTFANTGEGKRPFSPVNVEGTWDGSNNLTATFDSRSRLFSGSLGIDDNAEWEIEITNATPVRTIIVTAETFNYSAANQVTDGLVAGQIVEGRVRQTSDVNDGRWREFIIYGPLASTADSTIITADSTLLTADMG